MTGTAAPDIPIQIRARDVGSTWPEHGSELHSEPHLAALADPWPDRPYREGYGWPLWIPPTGPQAYISGLFALNLPTVPGEARLGDWHKEGTWWSPSYLDGNDRPIQTPVWGPEGSAAAAPGPPVLHDARRALAQVGHPAACRQAPVLAASIPQAIIDMAWGSLHGTDQQPCRHDIFRWTDATAEAELRELAHAIEKRIRQPALQRQWQGWRQDALHGPDPFHDVPVTTRLQGIEHAPVPVVLRAERTAG